MMGRNKRVSSGKNKELESTRRNRFIYFLIGMLLLSILLSASVYAEFDPEKLSQSTVRVVIKARGAVVSVASGFVWKAVSYTHLTLPTTWCV